MPSVTKERKSTFSCKPGSLQEIRQRVQQIWELNTKLESKTVFKEEVGTSLEVQWLRLHNSIAGTTGSNPG